MDKIKKSVYEAVLYFKEKETVSIAKVAKMFNIDRSNLYNYKNKELPNYQYEDEDYYYHFNNKELEAIEAHKNGMSMSEVYKKYGFHDTTLRRWKEIIGLNFHWNRNHYFNENAFNEIKTEEDAYWLGFILADGYVNEDRGFLNIKLGLKDEEHLSKFQKYMQLNENCIINERGGSNQLIKSLTLNSRKLINNLIQHNLHQRKSGKEQISYLVPKELMHHYIRGIIDGDGGLTDGEKRIFSVVGSQEVLKYIRDYINNNIVQLELEYIYEHGTIMKLIITKQNLIPQIYKHFYENANIYLERKYQVVQEYLYGRG